MDLTETSHQRAIKLIPKRYKPSQKLNSLIILRSSEWPRLIEQPQLLQSKVSRINSPIEITAKGTRHQKGDHKCTNPSLFWQAKAQCHPARDIEKEMRSSFTPKWKTSCLHFTKSEWDWLNYSKRQSYLVLFLLKRDIITICMETVTVQTDHQPLVSIQKKTIAVSLPHIRILLLSLSQHDVDIYYIKGKENVIANALSRLLPLPAKKTDKDKGVIILVHFLTTEILAYSKSTAEFRQAEGLLMQAVMNGWPGVKKGLSSSATGLLDLQRRDLCRGWLTI